MTPYLSIWSDFRADVPAGWTPSYDSEGVHFTEVSFAPSDHAYRLVIRWYARYATHRPAGGLLEMYGDPEVFVRQLSEWYAASSFNYDGASQLTEAARGVSIGEKKTVQFAGWLKPIPQTNLNGHHVASRLARLGKTVESDVAQKGGRQAWTVIPARSGFYVLAYFSPDPDFFKYADLYDRMVASFVLLTDGPDGASSFGGAPTESEEKRIPSVLASRCCFQ